MIFLAQYLQRLEKKRKICYCSSTFILIMPSHVCPDETDNADAHPIATIPSRLANDESLRLPEMRQADATAYSLSKLRNL